MKIYAVQSGSKGNATIIEHDGRLLLIDMGITLSSLKEALSSIGKKLLDLDALLLTHNHSDHVKGVQYLDPLPIYCTKGTYEAFNVTEIAPFIQFAVNCFKITPFEASHDAPNPVGFIIECGDEKLVYLTDSGFIPEESLKIMKNADYYMIEANHNRKKLLQTNRPPFLKQRIMSDLGHLANEDSAMYMASLIGDKTKEIILAHLSEEANTPELALAAYKRIFNRYHINLNKITIKCANQHQMVSGGSK